MDEWLSPALHLTTRAIEIGGISIIVIGILGATLVALWRALQGHSSSDAFDSYRANLGRAILLGLEFLVAADIISTVALEPTLQSLLVLGGIILIRTFLSFSLEIEIDGRLPWEKYKGKSDRRASSAAISEG